MHKKSTFCITTYSVHDNIDIRRISSSIDVILLSFAFLEPLKPTDTKNLTKPRLRHTQNGNLNDPFLAIH